MNDRIDKAISLLNSAEEKTNIDAAAKSCFISVMQLQRDFYSGTGYSVNEYARRLRLSNALCLIKSSDATLAEIAYSCGYSSQQALCREIKSLLGTTATKYRSSDDYYFLSPFNKEMPFQIEVSRERIPALVELRYFSPALRDIENRAVMHFLGNNPKYSGRLFGRNGRQRDNLLCYKLYIQAENDINTDGFEYGRKYPEYKAIFAQVRVKNFENEINAAWDYLYSSWLPVSMFDYSEQNSTAYENGYFEEYFSKGSYPTHLKLFLPITRKKKMLKISIEKPLSMLFLVSDKTGANAERETSRRVVEYLWKNHPCILKNVTNFYLRQKGSRYTCGVQINSEIKTTDNLHIISYKNQSFAVLYFSGLADFSCSEEMLLAWLAENNFTPMGQAFAVYETDNSYNQPQMKLYCPIKTC